MITEEHVTRATSNKLVKEGWEIIAVHPPDGQGPFTIPKPPLSRAIERGSYHPDIVAIKRNKKEIKIIIVECKVNKINLKSDIQKIKDLVNNSDSMLFICFRCQKFKDGPEIGVDYEGLSKKKISDLPIEFGFAYQEDTEYLELPKKIGGFICRDISFSKEELV